tara:strand:- start:89 stop:883 length:795 start_codon:yes stop_codon:yes gene_type:complete
MSLTSKLYFKIKKILFAVVLIFLFCNATIINDSNEDLFKKGNDLYNNGLYEEAIESYQKIIDDDFHSSEVYFNMANSFYKIGSIAESIFYYEKAKQLSPNDKDILNNIRFANNMTIDLIEELPKSQLNLIKIQVKDFFNIEQWTKITILLSWFSVILFGLYIWKNRPQTKRLFFILGLFFFLSFLSSFLIGNSKNNESEKIKFAIIFDKKINIQEEPNYRSDEVFNLHEGTKVMVLESLDNWGKIRIQNGSEGWTELKGLKFLN